MNATPLERFLDDLKRVEPDQLRRMREAWDSSDPATREEAWRLVTRALKRDGRQRQLDQARDAVSRWVGDNAPGITTLLYAPGSDTDKERTEARVASVPAVLDAVLAIVAADILDQDQRYALSKPWRSGFAGEWSRPLRRTRGVRATPAG